MIPLETKKNLYLRQVAHPGAAYPCFHSMKPQGILLFPPGLDASPSQGYTPPPLYFIELP